MVQQMKEIGCFACSHYNAPDQVKETKSNRGNKCAMGIMPGCKHLYITPGDMAFHLRSCHKQESMV